MELYAAFLALDKAGAYASTIAETLGCNPRTIHKLRANLRGGTFPKGLLQRGGGKDDGHRPAVGG